MGISEICFWWLAMLLKKVIVALTILVTLAGCLPRPKPRMGDFNGEVIDEFTKEPVPGVVVLLNGNQAVTDIHGKFFIEVLPPGEYDISLKRDWYFPKMEHLKHVGKPDLWTFTLKSEPISGKILYSGDRDGKREIYELNLSDRNITRLTYLPYSFESNPVRLDSDRIIFQSDMISGDYHKNDLFIYNTKTQQSERICSVDNIDDQHPSLKSKTDQKLVFKSMRNGEGQIFLHQINSGQPEVSLKIKGEYPVINPDPVSSRIAYVNGSDQLCIYDLNEPIMDKINPRVISLAIKVSNPCWSPDGSKIAFEAYENSKEQRAIYYIQVKPELSSQMYKITLPSGPTEQHKHPTWGGNQGDIIFFARSATYSSNSEIYAVKFMEGQAAQGIAQWLLVSKGPGSKDYPCWGN